MQGNQNDKRPIKLGDTARIDRRNTILAQIEAALLADKLAIEEVQARSGGSDPYNRGTAVSGGTAGVWNARRPR